MPVGEIVFIRSIVNAGLAYGMLKAQGSSVTGWSPVVRKHLTFRGLFGAGAVICFFSSLHLLPLADAVTLNFMLPVFTGLAARRWLGEPWGRAERAVALASTLGVCFITRPTLILGGGSVGLEQALGLCAGLMACVLASGSAVQVRQLVPFEVPPSLIILYWTGFSSVVTPFWSFFGRDWIMPWEQGAAGGFGLALGCAVVTSIGQLWYTRGLQLERAGVASTLLYTQIVYALAFQVLLQGRTVDALSFAGASVVLIGAGVSSYMRWHDGPPKRSLSDEQEDARRMKQKI